MIVANLINPRLIVNKYDKLTTGIIYMPISLAYISSFLKKNHIETNTIDLFGLNPNKLERKKNFLFLGETIENITFKKRNNIFIIFANQIINHDSIIEIIKFLKKNYANNKIIILENTQAVTAYSLSKIKREFLKLGADILSIGENENKISQIVKNINNVNELKKIPGVITNNFNNEKLEVIENLDQLPLPDWDVFNLKNYWNIKHAHGPLTSKKYLPILTSRGCPYPCKFCVIPFTNDRKWRSRSAKNVVDEIEYFKNKYGVKEFHLEDLNPTVNEKRTISICKELINRKMNITWKIVAGTKVESIKNNTTIELMAKSGCKYISISPESGSKNLMKLINKPFNIEHAINMIQYMNKFNIRTQACFVLGFPGEENGDLELTKKMIIKLTKAGLDEIAIFIITPIPGSEIFKNIEGYESYSELNFSPKWRSDYNFLNYTRLKFYLIFLLYKLLYSPKKILKQIFNFFALKFETKMEMVPYKFLKISYLQIFK